MYARKRDRGTFNRWLRFRIIAQGVTVAACIAGTYVFGADARKKREAEAAAQKKEDEERERRRFQSRLAEAEEAQRLEDAAASPARLASPNPAPASANGWLWWTSSQKNEHPKTAPSDAAKSKP